jgi:hypothetical protein
MMNDGRTAVARREDFIGFVTVERTDAQTIADAVVNNFTEWVFRWSNYEARVTMGAALWLVP